MKDLYILRDGKYIRILRDRQNDVCIFPAVNSDGSWNYCGNAEVQQMYISDRMALPEGLWLSTAAPYCRSLKLVAKLSDILDKPYDFTGIAVTGDELADFMVKFHNDYSKHKQAEGSPIKPGYTWSPSYQELANAVLGFLIKKAGIKRTDKLPQEPVISKERILDPDL